MESLRDRVVKEAASGYRRLTADETVLKGDRVWKDTYWYEHTGIAKAEMFGIVERKLPAVDKINEYPRGLEKAATPKVVAAMEKATNDGWGECGAKYQRLDNPYVPPEKRVKNAWDESGAYTKPFGKEKVSPNPETVKTIPDGWYALHGHEVVEAGDKLVVNNGVVKNGAPAIETKVVDAVITKPKSKAKDYIGTPIRQKVIAPKLVPHAALASIKVASKREVPAGWRVLLPNELVMMGDKVDDPYKDMWNDIPAVTVKNDTKATLLGGRVIRKEVVINKIPRGWQLVDGNDTIKIGDALYLDGKWRFIRENATELGWKPRQFGYVARLTGWRNLLNHEELQEGDYFWSGKEWHRYRTGDTKQVSGYIRAIRNEVREKELCAARAAEATKKAHDDMIAKYATMAAEAHVKAKAEAAKKAYDDMIAKHETVPVPTVMQEAGVKIGEAGRKFMDAKKQETAIMNGFDFSTLTEKEVVVKEITEEEYRAKVAQRMLTDQEALDAQFMIESQEWAANHN